MTAAHGIALIVLLVLPAIAANAAPSGSSLAPSLEASREVDARGLTLLQPERRRTPTGFLYPYPFEPPAWRELGSSFVTRGRIELGFLGDAGEDDETRFREYSDTREGFWLRDLEADLEHRESGGFASLSAGSIGREDGFYRLDLGRRGLFEFHGGYASLEHRHANDATVAFSGAGSERLTLLPPLLPGAQTPAQLQSALAGVPESEIAADRRDANFGFSLTPDAGLKIAADYRRESREGARPSGGALGFTFPPAPFGSLVETLDPINDVNHVWHAGVELARETFQAGLAYQGSAYENAFRSLIWERPTTRRVGADPLAGRYALAPDNEWHHLRADAALALPLQGRFTTALSWSRARQNDDLLAPTINPAVIGWTGADALARGRADARVDLWMADARLALRPWRPLTLDADFHLVRRDSDTSYVALNPANGFYGYVAEDGGAGLVRRYAALPLDSTRWKLDASARWRATRSLSGELEYAHEEISRENRARHVVRDDRAKLSLVSRSSSFATLRASYAYLHRGGSVYNPARDAIYYSQGPPLFTPPLATTSPLSSYPGFRQFDLASQERHEIELRSNLLVGDAIDLGLSGRYADINYDAVFGLDRDALGELGVDAAWQPSPRFDFHAFGQGEWRERSLVSQRNFLNLLQTVIRWRHETELWSFALGGGFRWELLERLTWKADYVHMRSRETESNAPGIIEAKGQYPSQHGTDHLLESSLAYRWPFGLEAALLYRFQRSTLQDVNQIGLLPNLGGNALYLGHVDDNYSAHLIGATLALSF
jgi:MtrB/PioB family decaheme-associated outer membrane protein